MPSRQVPIDPFRLKEDSLRIPVSVSMPVGYINALRRHVDGKKIAVSNWVVLAIAAYAKKTGVELPEIQ